MIDAESQAKTDLLKFGNYVLEYVKECIVSGYLQTDLECIADVAVQCGLIEYVPYDPEKHEGVFEDIEPGDNIYYWGAPKK